MKEPFKVMASMQARKERNKKSSAAKKKALDIQRRSKLMSAMSKMSGGKPKKVTRKAYGNTYRDEEL